VLPKHTYITDSQPASIQIHVQAMFDEMQQRVTCSDAPTIAKEAVKNEMNLRVVDANTITVAFDETSTLEDVDKVFNNSKSASFTVESISLKVSSSIPSSLARESPYLTLLNMYMKNSYLEEAVKMFEQMPERNIISCTILVSGYGIAGQSDKARVLYYQCTQKDLILWTAMINACVQHGIFDEALSLFQDMQLQRVEPDKFSVITLLTCYANIGAFDQCEWVHWYAEDRNMKIDAVRGTTLMEMCSKCGHFDKSLQIFGRMQGKDATTWTAIICGLTTKGQASKDLELFEEKPRSKTKPDGITFTGVLSACCHGGLVDEGQRHFQAMKEVYQVEMIIKHYSYLVNLLGHAGHQDEEAATTNNTVQVPGIFEWCLQFSWDPGGSNVIHRLEGKPILRRGEC
jgi:pentatricopeptide repeat protein